MYKYFNMFCIKHPEVKKFNYKMYLKSLKYKFCRKMPYVTLYYIHHT